MVIALIIGLTSWAYGARVIRAQTLALGGRRELSSLQRCWVNWPGASSWWRYCRTLISIIGVSFIGSIIYAIVTEATLEFLGL